MRIGQTLDFSQIFNKNPFNPRKFKMENLRFCDIPQAYKSCLDKISSEFIKKVYNEFTFYFLQLQFFSSKQKEIENLILSFIKRSKFITYKIDSPRDSTFSKGIICIEKKCLIIESIDADLFKKILELANSEIIDAGSKVPGKNYFYKNCSKDMENEFVQYTFCPIFTYLINRYFYPTNYFEDPSFFIFKYSQEEENKKKDLNLELHKDISKEYETNENRFNMIKNHINLNDNNENEKFAENDFIELQSIHSNSGISINLAIHIKTLYIFVIKKFQDIDIQHEIDFCDKYSHRCMTKFYGFIYKNENIVGFVYEYMSNGTLQDRMNKPINEIESFTIINRIYQAINYLHSNSLIHRDVKPNNILFNHDNEAFLSDFDRIREVTDKEMTCDIGNIYYTSPEQDINKDVSYPTDIFSFGLIVYFIFEKKELTESQSLKEKRIEFPPMTKGPKSIQNIYQKSVKLDQKRRITLKEIYDTLCKEAKELTIFDNYSEGENILNAIQYFHENVYLIFNDTYNEIDDKVIYWYSKFYINYLTNRRDIPSFIFQFGVLYDEKYAIKSDQIKPFKFFELAAKMNNTKAMNALGSLYLKGERTIQNIAKGMEFFILAAQQNDPEAFCNLALIYLNGYGIETNFSKALEYLKLAAAQNYADAFFSLGLIYYDGEIVDKDIEKAKEFFEKSGTLGNSQAFLLLGEIFEDEDNISKANEFFELSAKMNNPDALLSLGFRYLEGKGVNKDILKALEYLEKSSKYNNPKALFNLGMLYLNGEGVNKDYLKAKEYFEKSASLDHPNASFHLGMLYFNGKGGIKQDYKKAKECFEFSAVFNNCESYANSLLYLGKIYENGFGVEKSLSEAIKYYKKSADLNNTDAIYNLGMLYFFNKKDYKQARYYYELIEKENYPDVLNNLGFIYYEGLEVKKDEDKAIKFCKRAAEKKDTNALLNLANIYKERSSTNDDIWKANEYLKIAADLQNIDALMELGYMYYYGIDVEKSIYLSRIFFEKAANLNDPYALANMGCFYLNGEGVKQDFNMAVYYFERAAAQNNEVGLNHLGICYINGLGKQVDIEKGINLLKRSADKGYSHANLNIGIMYQKGKGFKPNYSKAIEYYKLSANQGNSTALVNLGLLYLFGFGVDRNPIKAVEYFEKSAKKNNSYAYVNLAEIYIHGNGVPKDYLKAIYYFRRSAEQNNPNAFLRLGDIYFNGEFCEPNYALAIQYYEMSANLNNSNAYLSLGIIYMIGLGVVPNYQIADKYFSKSAILSNAKAFFLLGVLYSGKYAEPNFSLSKYYFEMAAEKGNPEVLFVMGQYHSIEEEYDSDVNKAIEYYERNIKYTNEPQFSNNYIDPVVLYDIDYYNRFKYLSYNDLGLVYLIKFEDRVKAEDNFRKAAFVEYSAALNNLGLFSQFYLNNIRFAERMYESASKYNDFSLSEFNLGHNREMIGKIEESIEFFIRASNHENCPIKYKYIINSDTRLQASKTFIICLANLKLVKYFLSKSEYYKSKKYFIRALSKINEDSYFKFIVHLEDTTKMFSGLKSMILGSRLFILDEKYKSDDNKKHSYQFENEIVFQSPQSLFDFASQNPEVTSIFIDEITNIISIMESKLYQYPYLILFGRIKINKIKRKDTVNSRAVNINKLFYEGFSMV